MGKKILVIDDDVNLIKVIENRLLSTGYEVITANNGSSGVAKAKTQKPDLILLDLTMPVVDGYKVMERLRQDEETKSIPVIILTGSRNYNDVLKSFTEFGAVDYITKPFESGDLIKAIERALIVYERKNKQGGPNG